MSHKNGGKWGESDIWLYQTHTQIYLQCFDRKMVIYLEKQILQMGI
jgi:hypothetical protein